MVLAEKSNSSLKNGQRSRGPSPNSNGGASNPASPVEEDGVVFSEKIRVGKDFQAICPEIVQVNREEVVDRALLVWTPSREIADSDLDRYMKVAKDKYGYNGEQALGMLFWHKHDLSKAEVDLANFTPFPDEWTTEDKVLFEQAFTFHGKTFHRIKQMLPDKTMSSLVKYYYTWKKTRTRTSLMDRQARKSSGLKEEASEHGSEHGSNSDSETEETKAMKENGDIEKDKKTYCQNCSIQCTFTKTTTIKGQGSVCYTCYNHWSRTGNSRPTLGPLRGRDKHSLNWLKKKWQPPKGMHINHDDLVNLAKSSASSSALFATLDQDIASLKRQVQSNKQAVGSIKKKSSENIDDLRPVESLQKANARWTSEELSLAVEGVRKYGKNCKAIADIVGTKTEAHIRNFFVTYRKKYNLENVLREYETENCIEEIRNEKVEMMDTDTGNETGPGITTN